MAEIVWVVLRTAALGCLSWSGYPESVGDYRAGRRVERERQERLADEEITRERQKVAQHEQLLARSRQRLQDERLDYAASKPADRQLHWRRVCSSELAVEFEEFQIQQSQERIRLYEALRRRGLPWQRWEQEQVQFFREQERQGQEFYRQHKIRRAELLNP